MTKDHKPTRRYCVAAILIIFWGGFVLTGCAASGQSQSAEAQMSVDTLVQKLRGKGLVLTPRDEPANRFASQVSTRFRTGSDEFVEVYEFRRTSTAELEAGRIETDPSRPPFFYKSGNIIAVHYGTDRRTEAVLQQVMGGKLVL